jgi:hypothetical protein
MASKLLKFYFEADLRAGHDGLRKKYKLDPDSFASGDFIIFINKRLSGFKLYGSNNTIVYYRSPRGRIDLNTIQFLPQVFNAGKLDYDKALEIMFKKKRGIR